MSTVSCLRIAISKNRGGLAHERVNSIRTDGNNNLKMEPNQRKKFGLRTKPKILSKKSWIRDMSLKKRRSF